MAFNPIQTSESPAINMFCLIRYSDKTVVASISFLSGGRVSVEGVRECIAGSATTPQPGKRFSAQGENFSIHYQIDSQVRVSCVEKLFCRYTYNCRVVQGRVYAIVTSPSYSPRIAFTALDELVLKVRAEVGHKIAAATEDSLSRSCAPIFTEVYQKYVCKEARNNFTLSLILIFLTSDYRFENPSEVDILTKVQDKIEIVKTTMKENIQQLLINQEELEKIENATLHLSEQSIAFRWSII